MDSRGLGELNEAVALRHLLDRGPLTRGELRDLTGLAKPTTSEVLRRLGEAGLTEVVGRTSGGPGPNAEIHAVNPDAAFGAAISLRAHDSTLVTAVCDLTGAVRARTGTAVDFARTDPAAAVHDAVHLTCRAGRVPLRRLRHVQLGVPGSVHGDRIHLVDVPGWSAPGLIPAVRRRLRTPVGADNDVNLAAVAERARGIAGDADAFALLWLGEEGLGLAIDLGGTLLRGARGGAGEIGYMPVGLPAGTADFQDLVGGPAVRELARAHGIDTPTGHAAVAVGDPALLDALAERVAVGLAAVVAVLDPPLVVLAGEVGRAGGPALATAVETALRRISVLSTTVAATNITEDAVLLGALTTTLQATQQTLLHPPP